LDFQNWLSKIGFPQLDFSKLDFQNWIFKIGFSKLDGYSQHLILSKSENPVTGYSERAPYVKPTHTSIAGKKTYKSGYL